MRLTSCIHPWNRLKHWPCIWRIVLDRRDFLKQGALAAALLSTRGWCSPATPSASYLPAEYYRRLAKWCSVVKDRLKQSPTLRLKELEATRGWYHFPYTVLPAAVLYARQDRANPHYNDRQMLELAITIGDLLVREDNEGAFAPRLDSYRDVYMWIEAFGLLKSDLGGERAQAWAKSLTRNIVLLTPELTSWEDLPAYTENFIGTSPNHFAWWAATTLVGGVHLRRKDWFDLGNRILRRFATTEQNPDGFWGEHNPNGPTGGYNYLTTLSVGVYWEHTKDPEALKALRRATNFHENFTWPDGNLIELFNDRNRYWHISYWGQFAFTHFPDGRGYAELLMRHLDDATIDLDALGLLGQNALYYHAGPVAPPAPALPAYVHRLQSAQGGVRKRGPWVSALAGLIDTPLPHSQWFLDCQANLALFNTSSGPIINGAHSKHQPELATFSEKIDNEWISKPKGSRLTQSEKADTLALAYNSFSTEIILPAQTEHECLIEVHINGRGHAPQEAWMALQLCLKQGQMLTTGSSHATKVSTERLLLNAEQLGGSITHNGWTLDLDAEASLEWPCLPYNPYLNANETKLDHAVALLRIPLNLNNASQPWLKRNERTIHLRVKA